MGKKNDEEINEKAEDLKECYRAFIRSPVFEDLKRAIDERTKDNDQRIRDLIEPSEDGIINYQKALGAKGENVGLDWLMGRIQEKTKGE